MRKPSTPKRRNPIAVAMRLRYAGKGGPMKPPGRSGNRNRQEDYRNGNY